MSNFLLPFFNSSKASVLTSFILTIVTLVILLSNNSISIDAAEIKDSEGNLVPFTGIGFGSNSANSAEALKQSAQTALKNFEEYKKIVASNKGKLANNPNGKKAIQIAEKEIEDGLKQINACTK